jgi:hypothetical protein
MAADCLGAVWHITCVLAVTAIPALADHTQGLKEYSAKVPIYCSELTRLLILSEPGHSKLGNVLVCGPADHTKAV